VELEAAIVEVTKGEEEEAPTADNVKIDGRGRPRKTPKDLDGLLRQQEQSATEFLDRASEVWEAQEFSVIDQAKKIPSNVNIEEQIKKLRANAAHLRELAQKAMLHAELDDRAADYLQNEQKASDTTNTSPDPNPETTSERSKPEVAEDTAEHQAIPGHNPGFSSDQQPKTATSEENDSENPTMQKPHARQDERDNPLDESRQQHHNFRSDPPIDSRVPLIDMAEVRRFVERLWEIKEGKGKERVSNNTEGTVGNKVEDPIVVTRCLDQFFGKRPSRFIDPDSKVWSSAKTLIP
jgi:uncharacterized protein YdcH (DUF465 family)